MGRGKFCKLIIYSLVSIFIILVLSYFLRCFNITSFFYAIKKDYISIENIKLYTWQAQITVGLISLTLIGLILNKLDSRVNGQPIKMFVLYKDKFRLDYLDTILLVIIISIFNLIFIMYFGVTEVLISFVITNVLIILLFVETYNLMFNPEKYKKISKEYIDKCISKYKLYSENSLNEILENFREDINLNCQKNIKKELKNDIKLLCEILNKTDDKDIFLIINNIFMTELKNVDDEYSCEILEYIINNTKEVQLYSNLKITIGYIYIYKFKSNNRKYYNEVLIFIRNELIYEDSYKDNREKRKLIFEVFREIYFNLDNRDKNFKEFIEKIIPYECEKLNENQSNMLRDILLIILKEFIIKNLDYRNYYALFEVIFERNAGAIKLDYELDWLYETCLTNSVYLYYLIYKEELLRDEYKKSIKKFLEIKLDNKMVENIDCFKIIKNKYKFSLKYYQKLKNSSIKYWEIMPYGEAKCMIMDSSIDEFYILYFLIIVNENCYEEIINDIEIDLCRKIIEWSNENFEIETNKLKLTEEFAKLFNVEIDNKRVKEKYSLLKSFVNNKLVKHDIRVAEEKNCNENIELKEQLESDILSILKSNKLISFDEVYDNPIEEQRIEVFKDYIYDKSTDAEEYISRISKKIENEFLAKLIKDLEKITLTRKSHKIIEELKEKINLNEIKINIDKSLSYYSIWFMNDNEENKSLIRSIDKICEKYELGNSNKIIYLNNKPKITVEIVELKIKEYTENECENIIKSYFKEIEEKYLINNLLYEEFDAKKYIFSKYCYIKINYKIDICNLNGFLIEYK